jgi:hypothetical protein
MEEVVVVQYPAFLSIAAQGSEFARYQFQGVWKPYFWPLIGPYGNVVRGASGEHQHQTGLFFSYGGHGPTAGPTNIWSDWDEPPYGPCGKMLHLGFDRIEGSDRSARIAERVLYVSGTGDPILEETRDIEIVPLPDGECWIEFRRTVPTPSEPNGGPFMLSARVADVLRARDNRERDEDGRWALIPGGGEMSSATRVSREERFQGERWVDFSGTYPGGQQGLALMDHPSNPGFPGNANASAYGVLGLSHRHPGLDGGPQVVTYRYGAYVHGGHAQEGRVEDRYQAFAES